MAFVVLILILCLEPTLLSAAANQRYSEVDKQTARQLWAATVKKGNLVRVVQKDVSLPPETSKKVREFLFKSIEFELGRDNLPTEYSDYLPRGYEILEEVAHSSNREVSPMEVHQIFSRYYLLSKNVAQTYSQYKASFNASKARRQILRDKLVQLAGEKSVQKVDKVLRRQTGGGLE